MLKNRKKGKKKNLCKFKIFETDQLHFEVIKIIFFFFFFLQNQNNDWVEQINDF